MCFQAGRLARTLQASAPLSWEIISLCREDTWPHALSYWILGKATLMTWALPVSWMFCAGRKSLGCTHCHWSFGEHSLCAPMALGPDRGADEVPELLCGPWGRALVSGRLGRALAEGGSEPGFWQTPSPGPPKDVLGRGHPRHWRLARGEPG